MPTTVLHMKGEHSTWCVRAEMSQEQIQAMREDGIEVGVLENTIPNWVVNLGLVKPWCFLQDVWGFRNPFRN
jgi:hypothetical protein